MESELEFRLISQTKAYFRQNFALRNIFKNNIFNLFILSNKASS